MDNLTYVSWPGWETVRLIGRGSFGSVYEIQRDIFGDVEKAALKVISIPQNESDIDELYSEGYDEESITNTFQSHLKSIVAEYSLMRKMNGSSNIVNCDDVRYVQHDDGIGWDIFIKMELLTPLTKALPDDVTEETVVQIAKDMCSALELCKRHEIVHRDIKPQNIFVSPNGDYKLGDFGIAKTVEKTMGGTKIGTYKYMAPEVYNNQPYGSAADVYSLGLVLYWLLNERRMPFMPLPPAKLKAGMDEDARHRRLSGEQIPAPANGSDELKAIVLKACAYDPANRYHSAADMLSALTALRVKASATPTKTDVNNLQEDTEDFTATQAPQKHFEEEDMTVGPVFLSLCQEESAPTESNTSKAEGDPVHPFEISPTKKKRMTRIWLIFPIIAVIVLGMVMFITDITQKQKTPVHNSNVAVIADNSNTEATESDRGNTELFLYTLVNIDVIKLETYNVLFAAGINTDNFGISDITEKEVDDGYLSYYARGFDNLICYDVICDVKDNGFTKSCLVGLMYGKVDNEWIFVESQLNDSFSY